MDDHPPSSFRISSALSYQFNCYQEVDSEDDELKLPPTPTNTTSPLLSIPHSTLSLKTYTAASQLTASGVHKMWTMIQLDATDRTNIPHVVTGKLYSK